MRGDYDPTNIKPIATKDLISWAYQVSIDLVSKLIDRLTFDAHSISKGSSRISPLFVMNVAHNHIKLKVW